MWVDTEGLVLAILVLAADVSDQDGALLLLTLYHARYSELRHMWGDTHYGGVVLRAAYAAAGIALEVVSRPAAQPGFVPLPRRWVVERSLAWFSHCRRLGRDYERDPAYSEAWLYLAALHRMLKHLAPNPTGPTPYQRREVA